MAIFRPPSDLYAPQVLPETSGTQRRLFRHFQRRPQAVNVFLLSDGTVVQDLAAGGISAGAVPLPWNPDDPGGPYATSYDDHGNVTTFTLNPYITKVFYGGHDNPVTAAEVTTLTAAGYGSFIS